MPFKNFLRRGIIHTNPKISQPSRVMAGTLGYFDRLLGISAKKMQNKAMHFQQAAEIANKTTISATGLSNRAKSLQYKADKYSSAAKNLTDRSNSTRIKTGIGAGLGLTATALTQKALQNYHNSQNQAYDVSYNPAYYSQY